MDTDVVPSIKRLLDAGAVLDDGSILQGLIPSWVRDYVNGRTRYRLMACIVVRRRPFHVPLDVARLLGKAIWALRNE